MYFRTRPKNPDLLLRVGLATLVVASLVNLFVRPAPGMGADVVDAAKGFLYGVAIATMLLSVVWRRRMR